ncbi:hypothetical protein ACFV1U_37895 [Streptomyces microflavus]|uniref:hypothetical protein n=1 Tax=Streptomyces microflavus TaxID=1919 RepID=UPI0036A0F9A7
MELGQGHALDQVDDGGLPAGLPLTEPLHVGRHVGRGVGLPLLGGDEPEVEHRWQLQLGRLANQRSNLFEDGLDLRAQLGMPLRLVKDQQVRHRDITSS